MRTRAAPLETPGGNRLLTAVGGKDAGLPWFYFVDQQGAKIGDSNMLPPRGNIGANVRHPDTPQEVAAFVATLEHVAPHMTAEDREAIRRFLTDMHRGVASTP